jgi:type VI secretion system protein ImpG
MPALPKTRVSDLLSDAEQFGGAHPGLAGRLTTDSGEPSAERVREALMYLGATVVDRVADLDAEGYRALADVAAPSLGRPSPAATIIELSSPAPRDVPACAEVHTAGALPCRFRLVSAVAVGPWRAQGARIERSRLDGDVLSFDLVATGEVPLPAAVGDRARFYVDGPTEPALLLLGHLLAHASRAEITAETDGAGASAGAARAVAIRPYGLRRDEELAPETDGPNTGLSLLREYFLFAEKFRLFELEGLRAALSGKPGARRATVRVRFDVPLPAKANVAPAGLRAHCVPAVNLFYTTSEPRLFRPGDAGFVVRAAGLTHDEGGVYEVLGVVATPAAGGPSVRVPALRRFSAVGLDARFPYAFSTKRVLSGARDEANVALCLASPRSGGGHTAAQVITVHLLATNRARGGAVRPGELTVAGPGMPRDVRAVNIVPTSMYVPPPVGPEMALQTVVRAAIPRGDPMFALQSTLYATLPRGATPAPIIEANRARVRAVEHLEIVPSPRGLGRGYDVRLTIDESPFHGLGDVALFLRLLRAALDAQVSTNHEYRCEAVCRKSGERLVWPPAGREGGA